jgi:hypothetical protein
MEPHEKYVVLDDRLLPYKVAMLTLEERLGKVPHKSVEVVLDLPDLYSDFPLKELMKKAGDEMIQHHFTEEFILKMAGKMIDLNKLKKAALRITIYSGRKPVLLISYSRIPSKPPGPVLQEGVHDRQPPA